MPVFRNGTRQPRQAAALTRRLADELKTDRMFGQPIVHESQIGQSPRYNITVLWDEWAGMDRVARSRVILDAYVSADPSKTGQISIAVGLTTAEATSAGLLPFAVVPHLEGSGTGRRARVLDRLRTEPGVTVAADGGLEMRFRTLAEASSAAGRLRGTISEAEWIVVQTVRSSPGDDGT